MYDNEDEIKKKRRTLIIIIAVIILLILALLLFLFMRGSNRNKPIPIEKSPSCTLKVRSGVLGDDNIYTSPVVIEFGSLTPISEDIPIVKSTIGINENAKKDTYTVTKKGKTKVYGYITDVNGNTGTCELEVNVNPSQPSCELEVTSGTLGENNWYTSDVVVGFKSMQSNSEVAKIEKYYIEKKQSDLDSDEIIENEEPKENIETFTVKDNLTTELYGYVVDSNGTKGSCNIVVKKDSDKPSCSLKVISGTKNSSGIYTSEVVIGMDTKNDATSTVTTFGVGTKENYTQETFAVTAEGKTVVYGYVKDNAGNKGTCEITITRPTTTTPEPPATSYPSCTLEVIGGSTGGTYIGATTVRFKTKSSTNGATITSYGIGTSKQLNGKDSYTITSTGTHTIYGMVKDSNGKTAECGPVSVKVQIPTLLSQSVKVGDFVAYDAGTWTTTAEVPKTNGNFGGYTAGTSKNSSVVCREEDTSTASGWKVLSVNGNTVTIIHAGIPECYYHAAVSSSNSISALTNRAKTTYMNNYAQDARMFNYNDYTSSNDSFKVIGSHYYMATAKDNTTLYYASYSGRVNGGSARANGIRPVIVLKSDVKTTGKNSNGAWILTFDDGAVKDIGDTNIELPQTIVTKIKNIIDKISADIKNTIVKEYEEQ